MKQMRRTLVQALIACIALMPISTRAGLVGTDAVVAQAARGDAERVLQLLSRADVRQELQVLGIDADHARARVAALTDEEVLRIAGQLNALPAGGDVTPVVLGLIVGLIATIAYIYWK